MNRLKIWLSMLLLASGMATAADSYTCTGWGTSDSNTVQLNIPPTVAIPLNATTGSVIASGTATLPSPMACHNSTTGDDITSTSWSWGGIADSSTDSTRIADGVGLKLAYTPVGGSTPVILSPSTMGSINTQGFNWSTLTWSLVRLSGNAASSQSAPGNITTGQLILPDGTIRLLNINQSSAFNITATCALSTDKSTVELPDTDSDELMQYGYSRSTSLTASVTCPQNTVITNGTTLTLSTGLADSTDTSLVGSTGLAKGVAIEVLDDKNNRVSAQNGKVNQSQFSGATTQNFSVRMVKQVGQIVTPGTVQGSFILTLKVN